MPHGGIAQAGKVKGLTPHVDPQEKRKKKKGRAGKRAQASARFNVSVAERRFGPNHGAGQKEEKKKD